MRRQATLTSLLLLLLAAGAHAALQTDALLDSLAPRGHVNDFAGVMGGQAPAVESLLVELEQKTGVEVAVVTLTSLDGGEMADFANRLFESWGIGQAAEDNGLLLIAAIEDRQVRIEVGYGLEGLIPDARAGRVLDETVIPAFRQDQYGAGLTAGAAALAAIVAQDAGVELTGALAQTPAGDGSSPLGGWIRLLVLLFLIPFFLRNPWFALLLLSGAGRGRGFGGGGFGRGSGGGFGGFGGGMSGGGGAGRSW